MIGGIGNMLLSIYFQIENVRDPRVYFGELVGSSDNPTWATFGELCCVVCCRCVLCVVSLCVVSCSVTR